MVGRLLQLGHPTPHWFWTNTTSIEGTTGESWSSTSVETLTKGGEHRDPLSFSTSTLLLVLPLPPFRPTQCNFPRVTVQVLRPYTKNGNSSVLVPSLSTRRQEFSLVLPKKGLSVRVGAGSGWPILRVPPNWGLLRVPVLWTFDLNPERQFNQEIWVSINASRGVHGLNFT